MEWHGVSPLLSTWSVVLISLLEWVLEKKESYELKDCRLYVSGFQQKI